MKSNTSIRALVLNAIFGLAVVDGLSAAPASLPRVGDKTVRLQSDGHEVLISLQCPTFVFDVGTAGGALPAKIKGSPERGETIEVSYPAQAIGINGQLEARLCLQWSAKESILRKYVNFRLVNASAPKLLKEIVLERLTTGSKIHANAADASIPAASNSIPLAYPDSNIRMLPSGIQSSPAFLDGFFTGIEFPIASSRMEGPVLLLAHQPGWRLKPGNWYASRTAVYGVAARGEERETFERYIAAHHPPVNKFRTSYNFWYTASYDMGGLPAFDEAEILGTIKTIEEKLYKPYGVNFDTMIVDYGWSKKQSVWELDKKLYPNGLVNYRRAAAQAGSKLGMWISPASCYPGVQDNEWAEKQGYEILLTPPWPVTPLRSLCLAGPKYRARFKECLVEMVAKEGLRHFKLDGYMFTCPSSEHGHEPGNLSAEAIAEGAIEVFDAAHRAAPGVWLETTCMTWNPSPWWLFHVDSVVGCYGDDNCFGRAPSPVYRESLISSRDFYNLQGADRLPIPIKFQEVMGLNHFTDEDLMNEAVTCILRGNMFLPVYINPLYMTDRRWAGFAGVMKWANANATVLSQTKPLLPETWQKAGAPEMTTKADMPLEPYGYSHWDSERGLAEIRNPWTKQAVYALKLDKTTGVPAGAAGFSAVSLYPEPRVYGRDLKYGDTLNVPVAPYETIVLSLKRGQSLEGVPEAAKVIGGQIKAADLKQEVKRIDLFKETERGGIETLQKEESSQAGNWMERLGLGTNWTGKLEKNTFVNHLKLEADLTITSPQVQLAVFLEGGDKLPPKYAYKLTVNGMDFTMNPFPSKTKTFVYNISQFYGPQWIFLTTELPLSKFMLQGKNKISLEVLGGDDCTKMSVWVWTTKKGEANPKYPNALPPPEVLSLDGMGLAEVKF